MAIYFDKTNRLIIPRWRDYNGKRLSVEHFPLQQKGFMKPDLNNNSFIQRKIEEWHDNNTLGNAWELVNAAYVIDDFKIAMEAAQFLKRNIEQVPEKLKEIVFEILGDSQTVNGSMTTQECEDIKSLAGLVGEKIKKLKHQLSRNIRNEFLWIEMGRLYSILGINIKAEKCVIIALQLSNRYNRSILRAASRYYYHKEEYEKARRIVRSSPFFRADPLLLAAEISYSSKQERTSKYVKLGFELTDSKRFPDAIISELSGMLGTLEMNNDAFKSARRMTNKSLLAPNDNSLAQAEWIARQISDINIDPVLINMEYAYEARAFEHLYAWRFNEALQEGINWVVDQPFSRRAFHFVSYISMCLTGNFELAIEICEFGLKSNPDAFALINNLVFSYAYLGKLEKAKNLIPRLIGSVSSEGEKVFLLATQGFVFYRCMDYVSGKALYQQSIKLAETRKDFLNLKSLAEAYLIREQFIANEITFTSANEKLQDLVKNEKTFDVIAQVQSITNSIKETQKKSMEIGSR